MLLFGAISGCPLWNHISVYLCYQGPGNCTMIMMRACLNFHLKNLTLPYYVGLFQALLNHTLLCINSIHWGKVILTENVIFCILRILSKYVSSC